MFDVGQNTRVSYVEFYPVGAISEEDHSFPLTLYGYNIQLDHSDLMMSSALNTMLYRNVSLSNFRDDLRAIRDLTEKRCGQYNDIMAVVDNEFFYGLGEVTSEAMVFLPYPLRRADFITLLDDLIQVFIEAEEYITNLRHHKEHYRKVSKLIFLRKI